MQRISTAISLLFFIFFFASTLEGVGATFNFHFPSADSTTLPPRLSDSIQSQADLISRNSDLSLSERLNELALLERKALTNRDSISLDIAYIIHKKGVVSFNQGVQIDPDFFHTAIDYYQKAIAIRQHFPDLTSAVKDIANGLNNIGGCYLQLNQPYKAVEAIERALDISNQLKTHTSTINLRLNLNLHAARAFDAIGDYENSVLHCNNVITIIKNDTTYGPISHYFNVLAHMESGGVKVNYLSDPAGGLATLLQAKTLLESTEYASGLVTQANLYHNLGIAYKESGNYSEAIHSYRKSITINAEYERELALADNFLNLGVVFKYLHQWDSASYYLKRAGQLYTANEDNQSWADVFDNQGDVHYAQHAYQDALTNYNAALEIYFPDFDSSQNLNPDLTSQVIADKQHVLVILSSRVKTFIELYHQSQDINYLNKGWQTIGIADKLVTMLRSEFSSEASKINLGTTVKPLYEQAIAICWMLYGKHPTDTLITHAFSYSEKSRSIVLLEALKRAEANFQLPELFLEKEKRINQKTNFYEKALALNLSENTGFEDSLLLYRRKLNSLRNDIKTQYPSYYASIYTEARISPQSIQNTLEQDQSFVEYFMGEKASYAFLINKDEASFQRIEAVDSVRQWSEELISSLSLQDQSFLQPAHALYQHLIAPLKTSNQLKPSLIMVPDGILGAINFEILVSQVPTGRVYFPEFSGYLLESHAISYTFSGRMLHNPREKEPAGRNLLAIAPSFPNSFSIDGVFFDQLDHNVNESITLKTVYRNAQVLTGPINMGDALAQIPEHGILHLATHAKASSENGELSYILFGDSEDKKYYTKDLYNLDLQADLIVLSACETAVGTLKKGEGIINLARGFLYAGASSVATSLWKVREESNSKIVLGFHRNLQEDLSKSESLQKAKQAYIASVMKENQQLAHPYYWAPIILIGDDSPLPQDKNISKWITISFLGLGGVFMFRKWQKRTV